ncbi:hypothetical protein Tco_0228615 [Tanacetum coccineum]
MTLLQLQKHYLFHNFRNVDNSSQLPQPPPQSAHDSPPLSPSHTSETESSLVGKRKGKSRTPKEKKNVITHTCWKQPEERLLSETYVQISKNEKTWRGSKFKTIWTKVHSGYNRHALFPRPNDMITGKWTSLTHDCNKFVGIFTQIEQISGENDSTWLTRCFKRIQETVGEGGVHYEAWDVLKDHYKWCGAKVVVLERRDHTDDDVEEPNELF